MIAALRETVYEPVVHIAQIAFGGYSHVIPNIQLARALLRSDTRVQITMFSELPKVSQKRLPLEQLPERIKVVFMQDENSPNPSDDATVFQCTINFCFNELNGYHVEFMKKYYDDSRTRPSIVIAGLLTFSGEALAKYYRSTLWAYADFSTMCVPIYSMDVARALFARNAPKDATTHDGGPLALEPVGGAPPFRKCCCSSDHLHRDTKVAYVSHVMGDLTYEMLPKIPSRHLPAQQAFAEATRVMIFSADVILANDIEGMFPWPQPKENTIDGVWEEIVRRKIVNVGPLCTLDPRKSLMSSGTQMRAWLNAHRSRSVVFVSLGSWGELTPANLVRFATGLELSGRPIIWTFKGKKEINMPIFSTDCSCGEEEVTVDEDGLPSGWKQRMGPRVMVVPWVNQIEVLQHPATGCFVSHCGWNSIIETITYSCIPLVGVPVGAEQCLNAKLIEEVWHSGLRVRDSQEESINPERLASAIELTLTKERFTINARRLHKLAFSQNEGYIEKLSGLLDAAY